MDPEEAAELSCILVNEVRWRRLAAATQQSCHMPNLRVVMSFRRRRTDWADVWLFDGCNHG